MSNILEKIKKEVTDNKIVLYMKGTPTQPQCGFSATVAQCLTACGAKFHAVNILDNVEIRQGVKEFSNWPTLPQLYINGKFIGGCDIVKELHDKGELKKLVNE
ncbi:MAG: Grx4 family monothiol glutaredoxin [Deltaproteobacteria bacterium]|nr:Grx4 family monothiol glutaredoxin [Deltaproteobacteria bacterium]